jgi:divalent metal cation (Fe/Co/Zn/Cd) transporter
MATTEHSEPSLSSVPLVGVAVTAALASLKILARFFGNSYALIADGIESTADIVTSLVVPAATLFAAPPCGNAAFAEEKGGCYQSYSGSFGPF